MMVGPSQLISIAELARATPIHTISAALWHLRQA
ncbi:hypothetical protein FOQG_18435 [Fusarium oxysporum f. sp. raphani 54005]|uniref:Uncharacterized protein n=1 Tax=Fusarium oxysporum f. sp. raphani 54005 TaxID=1089458 RepID=X0BDD8_FUSOX|nr:hypothetical protein FOQG_18435 [Fusarium oxysporum f. sp. raphani 54005]